MLAADSARSNSLVGCSGPHFLILPGSWVLPDTLSTAAITGQTLTAFWRRQAQHFSGFTDNKKQEIVRRVTTLHRHIPSLFLAKRFSIVLYSDMGFSGMTWPWGEASEERGDETDTRRMEEQGDESAWGVPCSFLPRSAHQPKALSHAPGTAAGKSGPNLSARVAPPAGPGLHCVLPQSRRPPSAAA